MRYIAIDQVRGLAISAMILAHFGPGLYERIGLEGILLDILLLIGRFATPTFIALFAFTLAFAYVPKAINDPAATRKKLIRRSGIVLLCSIFVALPGLVRTLYSGTYWGGSLPLTLLLSSYGVLFFYALAIFSAGVLIKPLSHAPYIAPALLGAVMVFLGSFLGYDAWKPSDPGLVEWFRLVLVSGKYAYLTNFGLTLLLLTLGFHLRALQKSGINLVPILLSVGIITMLCSLSIGRIVNWRTLHDLYTGYDAPPQLWYLLTVAGMMLLMIAMFDRFKIPFLSFVMEHTGRNPLSIYVAHSFVLPAVASFRKLYPELPDELHTGLPFLIFLAYWAYLVRRSSCATGTGRTAPA